MANTTPRRSRPRERTMQPTPQFEKKYLSSSTAGFGHTSQCREFGGFHLELNSKQGPRQSPSHLSSQTRPSLFQAEAASTGSRSRYGCVSDAACFVDGKNSPLNQFFEFVGEF